MRELINPRGTSLLVPILAALLAVGNPCPSEAQVAISPEGELPGTAQLDSLLSQALAANPAIRAAAARVDASRAALGLAGTLPDLMLSIGVQNLPIRKGSRQQHASSETAPEIMTMRMVGIGQTVPYPGKRALRRRTSVL